MTDKINKSPILQEFHNEHLKEYKKFLAILLRNERDQERLVAQYKSIPKTKTTAKRREKIKKKIIPKKSGRPRVCFDYATASHIVKSEGIQSLTQYEHWYKMNRPVKMPKNPDRAYKAEWSGWGDFLGVYNEYTRRPGTTTNGKGKYRTFKEARAFARSLNLRGNVEWKNYVRSGHCPLDIPSRPDIVYGKGNRAEYWLSWKDFLGNTNSIEGLDDKINELMPVLYIARNGTALRNVYVINVIPGGKAGLIDHISKLGWTLVAAYYTNAKFDHRNLLRTLSNYQYGGIDEYIINNVIEIMEILSEDLERVI